MALAGRDQIERLALRAERPQGPAGQGAADVVGKHRPGAHRVDARLRQLARGERDGVAGREDVVMPGDAQACRRPSGSRAASTGNPALASQRAGAACVVHRISSASTGGVPSRMQPAGLDADDGRAAHDRDAARGEDGLEALAERAGKLGRISATSDTRTNDSRRDRTRRARPRAAAGARPRAAARRRRRPRRPARGACARGARARAPAAPRTGAGTRRSA